MHHIIATRHHSRAGEETDADESCSSTRRLECNHRSPPKTWGEGEDLCPLLCSTTKRCHIILKFHLITKPTVGSGHREWCGIEWDVPL